MKYSNVGGQAVMEGIMMRNGTDYSLAVRLEDGSINVDKKTIVQKFKTLRKIPIVRGAINFFESLVLGMSTLMDSAYYADEDTSKLDEEAIKKKKREEAVLSAITLTISIVLAVGIFFAIPFFASKFIESYITNKLLVAVLEGVLRIVMFIVYISLIALGNDIKRVFMYHGAEHKCINCIETGKELTVENVRSSSKEHKRCGTSFVLYVLVISIIVFVFIDIDSPILSLFVRILLLPLISGISYELIKLLGKYDNACTRIVSRPGMWLQGLTTREPDDDMIEVGIAAVEAVFDWKAFQEENF